MAAQREWFEKDYYKVLGVVPTASDKEITRAYRKLAKEHHPDANPGSEERFKEISAAYDVLGDAEKRKEYDEVRAHGPVGGFGGARRCRRRHLPHGGHGRPGRPLRRPLRRRRGRTRTTQRGPQRGADMEAQLHLSFQDAVHGVTTSVNVPQEVRCSNCRGSGAAPGTSTHTCPRCGGTGSLNDNQGLFSLSTVCPDCMGRGTLFDTPCPVCHGTGTEHKVRSVKVRIPAGVEDGQRIRVKGRGAPGQGMAPAGRPLRGRPRGQARGLRAHRAQPDHHGADHLPRGGAGDDDHGADARRQGHAQGAGRARRRARCCACAAAACRPGRVATARSRATCWSRSRWWCRPSSPTSRRRRWSRWPR